MRTLGQRQLLLITSAPATVSKRPLKPACLISAHTLLLYCRGIAVYSYVCQQLLHYARGLAPRAYPHNAGCLVRGESQVPLRLKQTPLVFMALGSLRRFAIPCRNDESCTYSCQGRHVLPQQLGQSRTPFMLWAAPHGSEALEFGRPPQR